MLATWATVATGLAGLALGTTLLNVATWPRGARRGAEAAPATPPSVSVLIPARNEERTIRATVEAAFAGTVAPLEVVVYDDGSTDETPAILETLRTRFDRLRVLRGVPLPDGWIGKPHACHRLSQAARGEILLFVDADTTLSAEGIERVLRLLRDLRADVVTAVPRQHTGSWLEHLVLPLLHVTYTSWLPLPLIHLTRDPRLLAANGQVLALRRAAYDALGGFEAVRHEVVDDMAICRRAKQTGHRVVFADGHHIAACRMYRDAGEVWRGFSKNLYEGIGEHALGLLGILALYSTAFVAPWALLLVGLLAAPALVPVAALGVAFNVIQRAVLAARHAQPWRSVLLHPVGVIALLAIAVNSFRWSLGDSVEWSGRVYAARSRRGGPAPRAAAADPAAEATR